MRIEGKFPKPVQAGSRNLYPADEIRKWLQDPEAWAAKHAGP